MVATIDSSAGKMRQLLAQLRPGSPDDRASAAGAETSTVEVSSVLQQLMRSPKLARAILRTAATEGSPFVRVDAERFAAVLRNLLENAVDAAGPDGTVDATLSLRENHAIVEVRDTGPGMDPGFIRDDLFSPFRTTKGEGYGIGAFESREFARHAGGRLEVESSVGKGTVMRLVLPAVQPHPIASSATDPKVNVDHERA
jgi:signal transduction histidine kinase